MLRTSQLSLSWTFEEKSFIIENCNDQQSTRVFYSLAKKLCKHFGLGRLVSKLTEKKNFYSFETSNSKLICFTGIDDVYVSDRSVAREYSMLSWIREVYNHFNISFEEMDLFINAKLVEYRSSCEHISLFILQNRDRLLKCKICQENVEYLMYATHVLCCKRKQQKESFNNIQFGHTTSNENHIECAICEKDFEIQSYKNHLADCRKNLPTCPICLEIYMDSPKDTLKIISLDCSHSMHANCLEQLVDSSIINCPICRRETKSSMMIRL